METCVGRAFFNERAAENISEEERKYEIFVEAGFFIRFRSKRGRIPNVSRRTFLFDIEGK